MAVPPSGRPRPVGADEVRRAVVEAAAVRLASEGTDASLRDIARDAGVNLGLIHRHVGNKDDLIRAVLDDEVARSLGAVTGASDVADAMRQMFLGSWGDGRYVRIVAALLLEDPTRFRHQDQFPGMEALRELPDPPGRGPAEGVADAGADEAERDARLMVAMAALFGWTIFEPQLRASFGQEGTDDDELRSRVMGALVALVSSP